MPDIMQQNISVMMHRPNLVDLPIDDLPPGLSFRWYEPGDDQHWLEIHRVADVHTDIIDELYERAFGTDPKALAKRQCCLFDADGEAVATATAWYDEDFNDASWGRVHWVAVVPSWQGRGVGRALMSIILHQLAKLGHDKAYLTTQTGRVVAINLYLSLGFVPMMRDQADMTVWTGLQPHLKYPANLNGDMDAR